MGKSAAVFPGQPGIARAGDGVGGRGVSPAVRARDGVMGQHKPGIGGSRAYRTMEYSG